MAKCMLCGKGPHSAHNVPKSMHKTKRMVQPNVQKVGSLRLCTRCMRTLKKDGLALSPVKKEAVAA